MWMILAHCVKPVTWKNTMDKQIDNVVVHIRDLERRLGEADNNLRYIKVVQSLEEIFG